MAKKLALYRKYRPTSFGEIVGQEHIVTTLTNALKLGRVGHAYLFVGPRGTGKTTTARLLARYVNCIEGAQDELCLDEKPCVNCTALLSGNQPDLIEIDAATYTGVDHMREIRESIIVAPMLAPYKVYVIDEAHMLSKGAVNALLKMLEEPPAHVIFILATTEVEKIPATILSRTQRFDFRTLSVMEIAKRLEKLAKSEGAHIDKEAIELIAQAADGSVRDGESLLDQTLSFVGESAGKEEVMQLLGIPDPMLVRELAQAILEGDAKSAMEKLAEATSKGSDSSKLAIRLARFLRDALILKADTSLKEIVELKSGSAYADAALELGHATEQATLLRIIPKVIEAVEQTKSSPIPELPLELIIAEEAMSE